jgi:hypothetical protein
MLTLVKGDLSRVYFDIIVIILVGNRCRIGCGTLMLWSKLGSTRMPLAHVIALSQEIYTEIGGEFECGTPMLCLECMSTRIPWVHIRSSLSRDIPVSQKRYTEIGDVLGCGCYPSWLHA